MENAYFVSCLFIVNLSQRLIGELIVYPYPSSLSSLSSSLSLSLFTNFKIFASETAWSIKAKIYMDPPREGGTKVCINGPGHMTKMAATLIYGKTFINLLLENRKCYDLETWHAASRNQALQSL